MKLSRLVPIVNTLMILLFICILAIFYFSTNFAKNQFYKLLNVDVNYLIEIQEAYKNGNNLVDAIETLVFTQDKKSLESIEEYYKKLITSLKKMKKFEEHENIQQELNKIINIWKENYKKIKEIENLILNGKKDIAITKLKQITYTWKETENILFQITEYVKEVELKEHKIKLDKKLAQGIKISLSIIIGFGIFITILLIFTSVSIKKVTEMSEVLEEMSRGEKGKDIGNKLKALERYTERRDEIGLIAKNVIKIGGLIENMISAIKNSFVEIQSVTDELDSNIKLIKKKTDAQHMSATQIATASEEMTATIADIAKNATGASDLANESMENALEGKKLSKEAMELIVKTNESTQVLKNTMDSLVERLKKIDEIVEFIKDVADQTNLLALNASIEAARAGEHGKGFAVVAEEIRKLAERVLKATEEIDKTIYEIHEETTKSVENMNITIKEVEKALKGFNKVKEALDKIVKSSEKVKDAINQIAVATEEQSTASEEIMKASTESTKLSQEIRNSTEVVKKQIEVLENMVENLGKVIKGE